MSMWQRFKKWALRDQLPTELVLDTGHHEMVGEPIISFIESLHREAGRRYVISEIDAFQYMGKTYHWMDHLNFYQLLDKKTGTTYQGCILDNKLYSVVGLPFELNHWEYTALFDAFLGYRCSARDRLDKMKYKRWERNRLAVKAKELASRAEFAKQFRENAE